MARHEGQVAPAGRSTPLRVAVVLGLLSSAVYGALCGGATPLARAAESYFAPPGVVFAQVETRLWTQEEGVSREYQSGGLRDMAVPSRDARNHLSGELSRDWQTLTLRSQVGLSEDWNLDLQVSQVSVSQTSSLQAQDGNTAAQDAVDAFGDEQLDGLGDLRLGLIRRSVFSDRHGYQWGFGLTMPLEDQQSDYVGRYTLATSQTGTTLHLAMHYTYFPPGLPRARLDLRPMFIAPLSGPVTLPDGRERTYHAGNAANVNVSWQQEFSALTLAWELEHHNQLTSTLTEIEQGDPTQTEWARLRLGWGNLSELEAGPVPLPYRVDLTLERAYWAYNAPTGTAYRLGLLLYF